MLFNSSKCKVMHIGKGNPNYDYFINNVKLTEVSEEKDLGVIIGPLFKKLGGHTTSLRMLSAPLTNRATRDFVPY